MDVVVLQEVKDIPPYRAVIAGSTIQAKQWLPETTQFIRANQVELTQKKPLECHPGMRQQPKLFINLNVLDL